MQEMLVEAGHAERNYWRDIWRYRELFYFLAWRDILLRYKQTYLSVAWVVLQPVITMVVFTVLFGSVARFHFVDADDNCSQRSLPSPCLLFFCGGC